MKLIDDFCHMLLTCSMWFMGHLSELTSIVAFIVLCLQAYLFVVKIRKANNVINKGADNGKESGE